MDLKEKLLSLSIAIIFVFFIVFGYNTFLPEPDREESCGGIPYNVEVEDCPDWEIQQKIPFPRPVNDECFCNQDCSSGDCVKGGCFQRNPEYTICEESYDAAQESRNRIVFIASLIIGLIALIGGGVLIKAASVSIGMMGGGILTLIYGTLRYWGEIEDVGRFVILGIVLGILVWVGYKKLSSPTKKK